jgi:uncharacterized protein
MSEENVEAVRATLARLNRGEPVIDVLSPDVVWEVHAGPEPGEFRGVESVAGYYRRYLGTWEDFRVDVEEIRDAGDDKVFLATRDRGRGKSSGVDVEMPVFHVWTLKGGKVIRGAAFPSRQQALKAAGLSE